MICTHINYKNTHLKMFTLIIYDRIIIIQNNGIIEITCIKKVLKHGIMEIPFLEVIYLIYGKKIRKIT